MATIQQIKECIILPIEYDIVIGNKQISRINEYTVRNIQLQVGLGKIDPTNILIMDSCGVYHKIRKDGIMDTTPYGMDTADQLSFDLFRAQK